MVNGTLPALVCRPQDSCTHTPDRLSTQNGVVGCYRRTYGFQQKAQALIATTGFHTHTFQTFIIRLKQTTAKSILPQTTIVSPRSRTVSAVQVALPLVCDSGGGGRHVVLHDDSAGAAACVGAQTVRSVQAVAFQTLRHSVLTSGALHLFWSDLYI